MIEYLICLILFIFSIPFFIGIGKLINYKNNDYLSIRFVLGYYIFTSILAVFGMIVQVFRLPWKVFLIYSIVIVLIFNYILFKKIDFKEIKTQIIEYLKTHYFILFLSILLLLIGYMNLWLIWGNNMSDDAYYITRIANLPYVSNPFDLNLTNGFEIGTSINPYIINTWELESSVWTYIFNITPTVYARFFLALFNIYLLLSTIYSLSIKIFKNTDESINICFVQFTCMICLIFSFNSFALSNYNLLTGTDLWQFNSAMYFGSSIIRTGGLTLLLTLFSDKNSVGFNEILIAILISIAMFSKSTIALPFLLLFALSYFIVILGNRNDKWRFISVVICFLLVILTFILPNIKETNDLILSQFIINLKSPLILYSLFVIFLSVFFGNDLVKRINLILLIIGILLIVNPINNLFEFCSVYSFVAARMLTNYMYTLIIIATIYTTFFIIKKISIKSIILIGCTCLSISIFGSFITYTRSIENLYNNYSILIKNPKLIPNSTLELSTELNYLSDNMDLYVLCPYEVNINGTGHTLADSIRINAPKIKNVSILPRFATSNEMYSSYSMDLQKSYNAFSINPDDENKKIVKNILRKYGITCMIVENDESKSFMKENGFLFKTVIKDTVNSKNYYIYIKNCG